MSPMTKEQPEEKSCSTPPPLTPSKGRIIQFSLDFGQSFVKNIFINSSVFICKAIKLKILIPRKHSKLINSTIIYVEILSYFGLNKRIACGASFSLVTCNFCINEYHPTRLKCNQFYFISVSFLTYWQNVFLIVALHIKTEKVCRSFCHRPSSLTSLNKIC
jgi:hypothetical protein